jgi:signal transduction histidine kinase
VARLSIHDCGAGIAAEQLARLGQRFARGSSTGSGLGLAIAHEIVRVHHGQIHVASRPGAGTTVVIDVPRVEP